MTTYKHTQIGYLMLAVFLVILVLFAWMYITARAEPPSYNSGTNLLTTSAMVFILFIIISSFRMTVSVDGEHVKIKFGWGFFRKTFATGEIASAARVRNHWYYGWGIRLWLWPKMWIFNVSGFDAVEIRMKNGKIYRIGTDEPEKLEETIRLRMDNSLGK